MNATWYLHCHFVSPKGSLGPSMEFLNEVPGFAGIYCNEMRPPEPDGRETLMEFGNTTILHFSDLHLSAPKLPEQAFINRRLIDDLTLLCDRGEEFKYVVFSGDLVNNPDEMNAYDLFFEHFVYPVSEASNVPLDRFVFCPGNHDVSWLASGKYSLELKELFTKYDDQNAIDKLYTNPKYGSIVEEKNLHYMTFVRSLSSSHSRLIDPYISLIEFDDEKLSFVSMNSTSSSTSNLFGDERGHLTFPSSSIFAVQNRLKSDHFVISLMHHPLSWFSDVGGMDLERSITSFASLHLFGHLHEAEPVHRVSPTGRTIFLQAPAIFKQRASTNGYCVIHLAGNPRKIKIEYRAYYDGPRQFGAGENVLTGGGLFYPDHESKAYWERFPKTLSERKFRNWLSGKVLADLLLRTTDLASGRLISEYFIAPPLLKLDLEGAKDRVEKGEPDKRVSLASIIEARDNVIFAAPREHGQTTLSDYIAFEILSASKTGLNPRLPIQISSEHFKPYGDNLRRQIRKEITSQGEGIVAADALMDSQSLVVLIDDVDLDSPGVVKRLYASIASMTNIRFIVFGYTTMSKEVLSLYNEAVEFFEAYQIKPFSIPEIKRFMKMAPGLEKSPIESLADQYYVHFMRMGIPPTPVYLSMFLSGSRFEDIVLNVAILAQNFVERMFKRHFSNDESSADYVSRIDLFAFVAQKMKIEGDLSPLYDRFIGYCREYYDHVRMKSENVIRIIEQTIRDGILVHKNDRIGFRFKSVFSFFVAQRMRVDRAFYSKLFEDPVSNILDIAIYCGLNRNDAEVLSNIKREVDRRMSQLAEECGWLPDFGYVDKYQPPRVRVVERFLETNVSAAMASERAVEIRGDLDDPFSGMDVSPTDKQRFEEEWAAAFDKMGGKIRRVTADKRLDMMLGLMYSLSLYANFIKNLQQIPGVEKAEHLDYLFQYWNSAIAYMIVGVQFFVSNTISRSQ